ncbi:MAG: hypothetical protein ABII89_02100 [Candidatus Omnitrophota bacterium]
MKTKDFKKPPLLRRRYLVNRPLQMAYSGFIVWAIGVGMIIAWLVTYYTIWSLILDQISRETQLPQILHNVNSRLFWTLAIPGLVLLLIMAWLQIFLSHRIAGPAYRLRKTMAEITRGLWPENIQVRNHDFLKDIIKDFNLLLSFEKDRYLQLAAQIKEASELLSRFEVTDEANKQKLFASREALNAALTLIDPALSKPVSDNNGPTKQ